MLSDARRVPAGTTITCEVCVVGAGAAGATAALELAARGRDVVLLEGGGLDAEEAATDTYRGVVEEVPTGDRHPPLEALRQKQLGGTTASWGGRCLPLDERDFASWPIGLADLEPHWRRAHDYLGLGDYDYSSATAIADGGPFLVGPAGDSPIADGRIWRYSPPTHLGKVLQRSVGKLPALRIYHHANVLRLDLDETGSNVTSVVAAAAPGHTVAVEAGAYVLAAGGLETTRLLLVSGQAAGRAVGAGHERLGRGYMTHVDGVVGRVRFATDPPKAAYAYELSRDGVYCRRLVSLTDEARDREGLLNFGLVFHLPAATDPAHRDGLLSAFVLSKEVLRRAKRFKSARYRPGGALRVGPHLRNVVRDVPRIAAFGAGWTRRRLLADRKLPSFLVRPRSGEYSVLFNAEQTPSDSNTLTLADERDDFGVPRLRVRWRAAQSDCDSAARTLGVVRDEFDRLGLGTAELPVSADELREALGGGFRAGTHAMGTTRMSASPAGGVVDGECRVHGVRNLYLASSSVFPSSGFAAPTLTIAALALRICDTIDGRR